VDDRLGRIFSPVSHLNSVKNSPELREAYEQTLPHTGQLKVAQAVIHRFLLRGIQLCVALALMQVAIRNLVQPLAEVDDRLGRIFSPVSHLNSVKNSPELRSVTAGTTCSGLMAEKGGSVKGVSNGLVISAVLSLGKFSPAAGGSGRSPGPHLLAGQPSQLGKKQPGTEPRAQV
jgi:hypothetical protein